MSEVELGKVERKVIVRAVIDGDSRNYFKSFGESTSVKEIMDWVRRLGEVRETNNRLFSIDYETEQ